MRIRNLVPFVALALAPAAAHAQFPFPEGARALGMGGAFTAVADDMYSPFWNPAGAAQLHGTHLVALGVQGRLSGPLKLSEIANNFPTSTSSQVALIEKLAGGGQTLDVSADFAIGRDGFIVSFAPVASGSITTSAVGLGGNGGQLGGNGGQQLLKVGSRAPGFATGNFQGAAGGRELLTYGRWITPTSAVGVNLNVMSAISANTTVTYNANSNQFTQSGGNSPTTTTVSGDVGYLQKISRYGRVGAMVHNLIGPDNQGLNPQRLDLGWADRPFGQHLLLAAAFQNVGAPTDLGRFNLGAELSYGKFALRGGLYRGRPTLGVGIGQYIDFAWGDGGALAGLHLGF